MQATNYILRACKPTSLRKVLQARKLIANCRLEGSNISEPTSMQLTQAFQVHIIACKPASLLACRLISICRNYPQLCNFL